MCCLCCYELWEKMPVNFRCLLFFALYMYADVYDMPGIVSVQNALFGSPLGETAQKVKEKKGKRGRRRESAHMSVT